MKRERRLRSRLVVVGVVGALALASCLSVSGLDDGTPSDASLAMDAAPSDAVIDDASSDNVAPEAGDSGTDARVGRIQDDTTIFCGPSLECSHVDASTGCCVTDPDAGARPGSYVYTCEAPASCPKPDGGVAPFIACDQGSDCPTSGQVCCWPSSADPLHTYCFKADAGNCATELCDPSDAVPCVNHAGYKCVSSGAGVPVGATTPLGYFVCVPP